MYISPVGNQGDLVAKGKQSYFALVTGLATRPALSYMYTYMCFQLEKLRIVLQERKLSRAVARNKTEL